MRPRLKDIARECNVDVATASRALNEAYGVHKETRAKVLAAAARLNYRPNRMAKGLATGRSHSLAMVVSDIRNPFFAELARGAEDAAYQAGYDLVLCNSDLSPSKQMRYIHSLLEKRVEGILMNSVAGLSAAEQQELSGSGVPIVLLNRPAASVRGFSTVLADNFEGGYLAGSYLTQCGHRVLGHLTGPREHGNLTERAKGFQKAVEEAKGTVVILRGDHSSEGAYEMMKKLLSQRKDVTAVFAANDAMAFGALRATFESGLGVPEDISMVGFDNVELAGIIRPPLTTVQQPKYEMGHAAVEILLRQAARPESSTPEHRLLEVKLVVRESSRALKTKGRNS
ncbi:MAG: LacI family DNA-binding transcriptional regulator [Terriglobia bacterium]